jgi:hypothetical protein
VSLPFAKARKFQFDQPMYASSWRQIVSTGLPATSSWHFWLHGVAVIWHGNMRSNCCLARCENVACPAGMRLVNHGHSHSALCPVDWAVHPSAGGRWMCAVLVALKRVWVCGHPDPNCSCQHMARVIEVKAFLTCRQWYAISMVLNYQRLHHSYIMLYTHVGVSILIH